MFLKAGALSLVLLLASRLLGLLRESVQAAALGTSAVADVAVLLLTLPDWLSGVLVGGALAYGLLPQWASQTPVQLAASQRRAAVTVLGLGLLLGLLLLLGTLGRAPVLRLLAPGLPEALHTSARLGLLWSALALPAALLALLWVTRLQHEQDFVGLYAANLVVNAVLVVALFFIASYADATRTNTGFDLIFVLGPALLLAMGLRLGWLRWRLHPLRLTPTPHHGQRPPVLASTSAAAPADSLPGRLSAGRGQADAAAAAGHPLDRPAAAGPGGLPPRRWQVWLWAALAAGLPLLLPFVARSLASQTGPGALATFNYAWKLVELPLVLAVQLVASLAFPMITRAWADPAAATQAIRAAFALAWTLACAATLGLQLAAPAAAQLLFGWGRMTPAALQPIAAWAAAGSWGLLPQALLAVALTVLATQGRMVWAVFGQTLALALLGLAALGQVQDGAALMGWLNAALGLAALVGLGALGHPVWRWLPWHTLLGSGLALLGLTFLLRPLFAGQNLAIALAGAALAAIFLIAIGWASGPDLQRALRRKRAV